MAVDISHLKSAATDTINIIHQGEMFAMILPGSFKRSGVSFFTPPEFSQQLAYISHRSGHVIEPHVHNPVHLEVTYTNEVLFVRKGRIRVDFYDEEKVYLESYVLDAGDIILLIKGGHGFEVLEEIEMIEVKQGPFAGDRDKTRFAGSPQQIVFHTRTFTGRK